MKDFRAVKTELACYAVIIFAAFLMGFAIKNLYDPVNLVTGGVSGVAIIFKSLYTLMADKYITEYSIISGCLAFERMEFY